MYRRLLFVCSTGGADLEYGRYPLCSSHPRPPDGHLSNNNQNFKKRRITPVLDLGNASTAGNKLSEMRMSKSSLDLVFSRLSNA